MNIHLHIERLVIDEEVGSGELHGLRDGLQRELTRLLRPGGLSHEFHVSSAVPELRVGGMDKRSAPGTAASSRIAHALYRGIGNRSERTSKNRSVGLDDQSK
jgi:hypothetical protein